MWVSGLNFREKERKREREKKEKNVLSKIEIILVSLFQYYKSNI